MTFTEYRQSPRSRAVYLLLIATTVSVGLLTRYMPQMPHFVIAYAGDTLYAVMAYLLFASLLPRKSSLRIGVLALGFCVLIELSQLFHGSLISEIRALPGARFVLGSGFLWSDLVCYAVGVAGAAIGENLAQIFTASPTTQPRELYE